MIRSEFDEVKSEYACWNCHKQGSVVVLPHPSDATHPGKLVCSQCGSFHFWLSKDKNQNKRCTIDKSVRDAVWSRWGNACSHCGISSKDLEYMSVMRTVQHAPPYRDGGTDEDLIPYCAWCQQRSESESKRIRSLIERLRCQSANAR